VIYWSYCWYFCSIIWPTCSTTQLWRSHSIGLDWTFTSNSTAVTFLILRTQEKVVLYNWDNDKISKGSYKMYYILIS